ncbi:MAG TPA: methyltransferase domain-containing protein [Acidimicrobiia bacterium]|jgi:SAM-dependent methyltransferase|nr:methyltransferase domain-containing protein [Acidimicrobiia bacterium]
MTTTEVRKAPFNELLALTQQLLTQAESLAALVARLKLDAAGEPGDPEVTAQLDRVIDVINAAELRAKLDERERVTVIGHATTMLRQAMELIEDPLRPGGWFYTDPQIIQGQGASSVIVAQLLAGAGIGTPDARILDIGTGVGALAIAFCRTFPHSTVVGIDPWELSLELARQNVAVAGLGPRVTLRQTRIEAFEDEDGFDLVWMPVIFLAPPILKDAVQRAVKALRPGAEIVLGRYTGSDDPLVSALGDLRTIRSGGTLLGPADTRALLEEAGLADVREIDRTWPAPLGLTVGRRPTNT